MSSIQGGGGKRGLPERGTSNASGSLETGNGAAGPAGNAVGSPNSSISSSSPHLITNHVSNTGVVVQLRQIQYSHGFRCYRVERQSSQGENAGPDGNYRGYFGEEWRAARRAGSGFELGVVDDEAGDGGDAEGMWKASVRPASWRTVITRLVNMNDFFLLLFTFSVILQPLLMGGKKDTVSIHASSSADNTSSGGGSFNIFLFVLISPAILIPLFRMFSAFTSIYIEEVVVIAGVGMQLTSYGIFNNVKSSTFVDLTLIRSIVIHDTFFRNQPIFFLSASVENSPKRIVFFPNTLPRLEILLPVLRGVRSVLYGEPEFGRSLAEMEESLAHDFFSQGGAGDVSGAAGDPDSEASTPIEVPPKS